MSLPCPKCGNTLYYEDWRKNPFGVDFVYPCCGTRREFYYDFNGWESKEARQKRVRVPVKCECGKTFYLAHHECNYNIDRSKQIKCPKCIKQAEIDANKRKGDNNRAQALTRKKPKKKWLAHFKHGGHNGCQKD